MLDYYQSHRDQGSRRSFALPPRLPGRSNFPGVNPKMTEQGLGELIIDERFQVRWDDCIEAYVERIAQLQGLNKVQPTFESLDFGHVRLRLTQ
jgi:hypothetical protein